MRLKCTFLILTLGLSSAAAEDATDALALLPGNLVSAKMVSTSEKQSEDLGNYKEYTFEIFDVFVGENELVGKQFKVSGKDTELLLNKWPPQPTTPSNGEHGIWLVSDKVDACVYHECGIDLPVFHHQEKEFSRAVRFAHATKRLGGLKRPQQIECLQSLAVDDVPEISAWSIARLGEVWDEKIGKSLIALLPNQALSLPARLMLDEVISERDSEAWNFTKERERFLNRCFEKPITASDAHRVIARLGTSAQRKEIDDKVLIDLLNKIITKNIFPDSVKPYGLFSCIHDKESAFDFLNGLVASSADRQLMIAAAHGIAKLKIDDAMRKELKASIDKITDEEVKRILLGTLKEH